MSASSSVTSSPYHEKYHFKNQYEDYTEDKAKPYIDNNAVNPKVAYWAPITLTLVSLAERNE